MIPSFRLDGPVALVTGAAGGIGARVALGLAEFGADVGCLDAEDPATTVAAIQESGRRAAGIEADVADAGQVDAGVARVQDVLGPLRHAVDCAGIHSDAAAETPPREQWQRLLDVDLTGVVGRWRRLDRRHRVDLRVDRQPRGRPGAPPRGQGRRAAADHEPGPGGGRARGAGQLGEHRPHGHADGQAPRVVLVDGGTTRW